ncbi:hypothetical protein GNP61_08000 [Aliivibrio fischeri]|uniref:hypothetical protein n=1 Tax=Aliivibrio fischeri TaxID=668 RepID=UPI0012DA1D1E|nr:hypothetical protein [Aliivibrio fischeri]MUK41503.1 hypothetical protein [Aliivibrio fischeri]
MSTLSLATFVILPSEKELKRHRKLYPSQFERIVENGSMLRRYYSMTPAVLYGEFIKQHIQPQNDFGRFVYIERLDDESSWYGAAFEDGQLLGEYVESFEQLMQNLAYDCHLATHIFTPTIFDSVYSHKLSVIEKLTASQETYQLERVNEHQAEKIMGGLILIVLALFISLYLFMPKQEQPVSSNEPIIDPTAQFIQSYNDKLIASNVLTNAIHLLTETALLPTPLKSDAVTLSGNTLIATLDKSTINEQTWKQWRSNDTTLNALYVETTKAFTFPITSMAKWQPFDVTHYLPAFLDALKLLNITVTNQQSIQYGDITTHSMLLTMKGEISKALILSELIDNPAITTNALTLTRTSTDEVSLTLSLSIHGITYGN